MATLTFDTLKFVERLTESGFSEPQARGMSSAIQEVQQANLSELATKADLQAVKQELKSDMRALETTLKSDIREMDARIMGEIRLNRWMLLLVVAATVLPALKTLFGL